MVSHHHHIIGLQEYALNSLGFQQIITNPLQVMIFLTTTIYLSRIQAHSSIGPTGRISKLLFFLPLLKYIGHLVKTIFKIMNLIPYIHHLVYVAFHLHSQPVYRGKVRQDHKIFEVLYFLLKLILLINGGCTF